MSATIQFTEKQSKALSGEFGYFYAACADHFGFLVSDQDYMMVFHNQNRDQEEVSFTEDIQSEYFEIRVCGNLEVLPSCRIRRFAGTDYQTTLWLPDACELLGVACPRNDRYSDLPFHIATPQLISDFAQCIQEHFAKFRGIPIPQRK